MSKYTIHAKHVLKFSYEEAHRLNSPAILPEHLMLGILRDGQGKAIEALLRQGVDLEQLRLHIENLIQTYTDSEDRDNEPLNQTSEEESLSRESDRTLKLSQLEARMLCHSDVDTEHIVLAMLKDKMSSLSTLFLDFNVDYSSFYNQISEMEKIEKNAENETISDNQNEDSADENYDEENMEGSYSPAGQHRQSTTSVHAPENSSSHTPTIDHFGFDMTQAAREQKLDPVVGREVEIERLTQILSRRKKNNPILLGEPGVGKTAIVEGLAQRIADKKVNFMLKNKRIVSLDMAGLVAGTKYRGQFEERLKGIMHEAQQNPDIILYIDEIHSMVGAGNAQGSMDAANILKPALSRGEIQCIGATTIEEFRKTIEKDGALERRFQKIIVEPTSTHDTLEILHNLKDRYEEHHNVTYTDDALKACVTLSDRYVSDRNFPDKAIDALDEAGSRMHIHSVEAPTPMMELEAQLAEVKQKKDEAILQQHYEEAATYRDEQRHLEAAIDEANAKWNEEQRSRRPIVDAEKIAEVVSQMTGIPVQKVASSEGQKLLKLREILHHNVIGQSNAIDKVVRAIQRNRLGLKDPQKPIGTFLFLGPTGVGKTYLAKKIADELFATRDSLIRIDMSEYMEKYSTSRLIGAAPGYVGYDEGGQLTERVRRHPYSVILFDEIEKADKEVFNLMLQLFDEGHLTDAQGRKIDFKNCIIILTSNVGSRQLGEFGTGIGFQQRSAAEQNAVAESVIRKELRKTFSPEFLNRIDEIITFDQLQNNDIRQIVEVELKNLLPRLESQGYCIEIDDNVKDFLAEKGYDPKYGARPLKRAIQTYIEDTLCEGLLEHQDESIKKIHITLCDNTTKACFE